MKNETTVNIEIEYGKENLKQILIELLKEQYINYITINDNLEGRNNEQGK